MVKIVSVDYTGQPFDEQDLRPTPVQQFEVWFQQAVEAQVAMPEAMTLSTVSTHGAPSSRVVLLKDFDERGFVFYTNYESRKSRDMNDNHHAALCFFWGALERQVRVEGRVERVSAEESDAYFASRPRGSQIGAWASEQSVVIPSRAVLEEEVRQIEARFADQAVTRPPFWGGWRVVPHAVEFWQGRSSRLHDRLRYRRSGEAWVTERLSP